MITLGLLVPRVVTKGVGDNLFGDLTISSTKVDFPSTLAVSIVTVLLKNKESH